MPVVKQGNKYAIGSGKAIYKTKEIGEQLIKYCYELKREDETDEFSSEVFPWTKHLSNEERILFSKELMESFLQLISVNDFEPFEEVISEWKATAEALTNPQLMDVVNTKDSDRSYSEIA